MKNKYILIFLIIIGFSSCMEDFLDQKPNEYITKEEVFTDFENTKKVVTRAYEAIWGFTRWTGLLSSACDEAFNPIDWVSARSYTRGELSPDQHPLSNIWENFYFDMRTCNLFLDNVESYVNSIPASDDNKEKKIAEMSRLKGEAKWMRAFHSYTLLRFYGRVCIIDHIQPIDGNLERPRNSIEEITEWLCSEMDEAALLLPISYQPSDAGRVTRGACYALKCQLLLHVASPLHNPTNDVSKWKRAADETRKFLEWANTGSENGGPVYRLYTNSGKKPREVYQEIFLRPAQENSEVIHFRRQNTDNVDGWNNPISYGGWGGNCPTQNSVDKYRMNDGLPAVFGADATYNSPNYDPHQPYKSPDDPNGRDPRFYATVLYNGAMWRDRAVESYINGKDGLRRTGDATETGYYMKKFVDEGIDANNRRERTCDWILYRLSEFYLNLAEAENEVNGPTQEVLDAVNLIRQRVNMPDITPALLDKIYPTPRQDNYLDNSKQKAQMREAIRDEKFVELWAESQRFFDIRRWKIGMETQINIWGMEITKNSDNSYNYNKILSEKRVYEERFDLFPIPSLEINRNIKMDQNPGW